MAQVGQLNTTTTTTPQTEQAVTALIVNTAIGAVITGILFICGSISVFENRRKLSLSNPITRWRLSLLAAAMFSLCVFLLDGMLVWRSWTGNEYGCEAITIPHVLFYCFEKQSMNLFLYDRAKIVHESLHIKGTKLKYIQYLRLLLWLTLVLGFPVFFYWSPFVAFTGVVFDAGNCVYYVLYPIVPILFAISDAFLALGMSFIFLVPLMSHVKDMGSANNKALPVEVKHKKQLEKVVYRNLFYACIALCSGLVGLVTLSILEWVANADDNIHTNNYRIWASFAIAFDNFIGVTAVHLMTTGWLPRALQKRMKFVSTTENTGTTGGTGPMNNKIVSSDEDKSKRDHNNVEPKSQSEVAAVYTMSD
jgi:hypothetical protein